MLGQSNFSLLGLTLLASGLLLLCGQVSRTQVTLTLDAATLTGPPGSTLTFTGVLTNTTNVDVPLGGSGNDPLLAGFVLDDTDFFLNAPLTLAARASTPDIALFTVTLNSTLAQGASASSMFRIFNDVGVQIGNAPFTARAFTPPANVPEPGSFALLGAGLSALSLFAATRLRRKPE